MKKAFSKKNLWEKSPSLLKATIGRGLSIFPIDWLLGGKFKYNCNFLKESQYWLFEKSRQYQIDKLKEILTLAYQKTKFYQSLFESVGFNPNDFTSLEDMQKIPTIDKQTVIDNISNMCTLALEESNIDYVSTGGTGGSPLHFYINADRSSVEYAYLTISWQRAGYRLGMPMAVLRGKVVKPDKNSFYHEYDPILRHHYYSTFHMSEENISRYLEHIATIGPCFMHVYPSSVTILAKFIQRNKIQPPGNIKGIIAESEMVYSEQRKVVEDVFRCRLFSCYGQSEKIVLASGCEKSNDYHIWPTYGYFELLDENGDSVVTSGQRGEIVGTGFINTVMPFIRYRTGDWATYISDRCEKCGREHIVINDIRGHRIQEVLIASDGSEISWTSLNMHDDTFINVKQFQFTQKQLGRAVLQVVPAKGFNRKDIAKIQSRLSAKLDNRILLKVKTVKEIPLSKRGKAIYVDQQITKEITE